MILEKHRLFASPVVLSQSKLDVSRSIGIRTRTSTQVRASGAYGCHQLPTVPTVIISGFLAASMFVYALVRSRDRGCSNPSGHHAGSHGDASALCHMTAARDCHNHIVSVLDRPLS